MNVDEAVSTYVTELQPLYKLFGSKVQELVYSILKSKRIVPHSVTAREKSAGSLKEKIERDTKAYENPLNEISDLAGVRIITYFPKDVDMVLPLLKAEFTVDADNSVDKRNAPDPSVFGYASVHLVVEMSERRCSLPEYAMFRGLKCEIQVRTILQHAWAEIEHDIAYKTTDEIPFELRRKFASLAGLLEVADREFEMLRHEETQVRERIAKTIKGEDLNVPVNLDSLTSYLRTYHKESGGLRPRRLLTVVMQADIKTIQEVHVLLDRATLQKADAEVNAVRDACAAADSCLVKYIVAIATRLEWSKEKLSEMAGCPALRDPVAHKKRRHRIVPTRRSSIKAKGGGTVPNKPNAGDGNSRA